MVREAQGPGASLKAVYGLPEIHREAIRTAELVANPGCYPTSVILALAPLFKLSEVDNDLSVVDSKSGISGAGREQNWPRAFARQGKASDLTE